MSMMSMTSATASHMFYDVDEDSNRTLLWVLISPNKISLSERVIAETGIPGVTREILLYRTQYELLANSNGEKYLKLTRMPAKGETEDVSLRALFRSELVWPNQYLEMDTPSTLIYHTIAEWFGYPLSTDLSAIKAEIFFPALKTMGHLMDENHTITQVLSRLQNTLGVESDQVVTALRENSDWSSFVRDICHEETASSEGDQNAIWQNPDLLHMAVMKLSMSIHEVSEYEELSYSFLSTFDTAVDRRCISFMLDYLPEPQRSEATKLLFDIATRYTRLSRYDELNYLSSFVFSPGREMWSASNIATHKVPHERRPELSQLLLSRLYEVNSTLIEAETARSQQVENPDKVVESGLYQVFVRWVTEHVVVPALETALTQNDIDSRFTELYGEPLFIQNGSLSVYETKTGKFVSSSDAQDATGTNILNMMNSVVRHPVTSQGMDKNNYYLDNTGQFCPLDRDYYSFDDVMNLIKTSAKKIDSLLATLNREVTPQNRFAYLTFQHRERRAQSTWFYYDLGVTEPSKIIALKICKITDEDDIRTYAALPDELFYELISLLNERAAERSKYFGSMGVDNTERTRYLEEANYIFD